MTYSLFDKKYFEAAGYSDIGSQRRENQDAVLVDSQAGCFAVSDGMGGGEGGGLASKMVVKCLETYLQTPHLLPAGVSKAVYRANELILEYSKEHFLKGMGATVVGIALNGFNPTEACVFHAGDSRAYRFRRGKLTQLTQDHTFAGATGKQDKDTMTQNVLLNAVGLGDAFYLEMENLSIESGDCYLLCSDGLYRQVPEKQIRIVLNGNELLQTKVQKMIDLANAAGGEDNISVLLLSFGAFPAMTEQIIREKQAVVEDVSMEDDVTPPTK